MGCFAQRIILDIGNMTTRNLRTCVWAHTPLRERCLSQTRSCAWRCPYRPDQRPGHSVREAKGLTGVCPQMTPRHYLYTIRAGRSLVFPSYVHQIGQLKVPVDSYVRHLRRIFRTFTAANKLATSKAVWVPSARLRLAGPCVRSLICMT